MSGDLQFLRRAKLTVAGGKGSIDLSNLRIRFTVKAADVESPNNASIRIYNLATSTIEQIVEEYREISLEAGYEFNLGVIFKGTIKWYRVGREEGSTDSYLDLLAADGDLPYNQAYISKAIAAGATAKQRVAEIAKEFQAEGLGEKTTVLLPETGGILPRGKVLFGMARVAMRKEAESAEASWSIQDNELVVVPKDEYLPGEAVVLTGHSGLIGRPEQTVDGIKAKCLINPKLRIASLVKLDNASINKSVSLGKAPVAYDSYTNLQFLANLSTDGLYRVYVIEYVGDTRSNEWYCTLTLLAVDPKENLVIIE